MSIEQKKGYSVITKEGFTAVGFKWEGTFADAAEGGIRRIQAELRERLNEVAGIVEPDALLGLSYHTEDNPGRFTHYACVEVTDTAKIPEGMVSVAVPSLRYAKTVHHSGESVEESYNGVYRWIQESDFTAASADLTHFEQYPMDHDPFSEVPTFIIMIPLISK